MGTKGRIKGMRCPACGGGEHRVVGRRVRKDGTIRRYRACPCGFKFRTLEEVDPEGRPHRKEAL